MRSSGRTAAAFCQTAVLAMVLVVVALGFTLLVLLTPAAVRSLVTVVGAGQLTGLGTAQTLETAEAVRGFVVDPDAPALPADIEGRPAFDEAAVSHLIDVRDVIVPSTRLAIGLGLVALAWLALGLRTAGGRRVITSALRVAGGTLLAALAVAGVVGLTDFDRFFTWFHGLFFAPGTWQFPADALLIRVFPLPFWTAAAGVWAGLLAAAAVLMLVAAWRLRFTGTSDGV